MNAEPTIEMKRQVATKGNILHARLRTYRTDVFTFREDPCLKVRSKAIHFEVADSLKEHPLASGERQVAFSTVRSATNTNEPMNPPAMVDGWLAASCVRNSCIDANSTRAMSREKRNDELLVAPRMDERHRL